MPVRLRTRLGAPPRLGGVLVATVFAWESLNPTLLPRPWLYQAAITAICIAVGYGLGTAVSVLVALVRNRRGSAPLRTGRLRRAAAALVPVVVLVGVVLWHGWQQDQRALVGLDGLGVGRVVPMVLVAAVLTVLLVTIGRSIGHAVVWFDRLLAVRMPRAAAHAVAVAALVSVVAVATNRLVVDTVIDGANASFGALDDTTEDGIEQPQLPELSGSPESLAAWDTLGFQGRTFVGSSTSVADLRAVLGADAEVRQPIRAYAGLRTADDADERAAVAVAELERTGAFDRAVLVVAGATGTGWINPESAAALEYLHGGDTAIVSIQYSYLPSWISFLVDKDTAAAAGEALLTAVVERWSELDEADRPRLVAFGESLGSFGSEAFFVGPDGTSSVARILEQVDAALWVGPTESNRIRRQLTEERDPGSPAWRPTVGDDGVVVFANRGGELEPGATRVVYLLHPSDPVTWWEVPTIWRRPAWLEGERGYDVPDRAHWFPFVTWLQTTFDLIEGFGTGPGHGHNYNDAWVEAWAAVAPPAGWTRADTDRLVDVLAGG